MLNAQLTEDVQLLPNRRQVKTNKATKIYVLRPEALRVNDALQLYLKDYTAHKDFAPRTIEDYANHMRYLAKWANEEGHQIDTMTDFDEELVREYRNYMIEEFSAGTVNVRMRTLHAFLLWAHEQRYITESLHQWAKQVKVPDDGVRFLRDDEVRTLLDSIALDHYEGFRDYVMTLVMLDCGIRISELLKVTWDMVDFDGNTIRLPGRVTKNRTFRGVPLSEKNTVPLLKHLRAQNHVKYPDQPHLFLSYRGRPLDPSSVRHILSDYAQAAGLLHVSPHMLRHTFARSYVRAGGNVYMLQEILGHTTLEMSRKYVRLFSEEIAEEHQKKSPVDQFLN